MLGGFALDVLDAAASSKGWSAEETVEHAIRAYLDDRQLRPPGWACLPLPERGDADQAGGSTVEVELPDDSAEDISAEAGAQGVALAEVVAHALMYFWAAERPPAAMPEEGGDGLREDADVKVPAAGRRLARHRTLRGTSGG
jgi:hypothetical protein